MTKRQMVERKLFLFHQFVEIMKAENKKLKAELSIKVSASSS